MKNSFMVALMAFVCSLTACADNQLELKFNSKYQMSGIDD